MTIADIGALISFLTKTSTTSFPAADRLIMVNDAYRRVVAKIMTADGRWEYEDSNQTDLPIGTTALVSGQQDYSLTATFLGIRRVEVKNSSGSWQQLLPYDDTDFKGSSITQESTATGVPVYYNLLGSSVFLLPVPNYSQAASLKFYFERGPAEFTSAEVSTGTKEPGFASLFHTLLAYWPAFNYAVANGLQTASGYMAEIQRLEDGLVKYYARRNKDDTPRLTMQGISFR